MKALIMGGRSLLFQARKYLVGVRKDAPRQALVDFFNALGI